jgi:hypothetical protein
MFDSCIFLPLGGRKHKLSNGYYALNTQTEQNLQRRIKQIDCKVYGQFVFLAGAVEVVVEHGHSACHNGHIGPLRATPGICFPHLTPITTST